MDVVLYRSGKPWADPIEDAMIAGLRCHGLDPEQRTAGDFRVSDLAVIWSHRERALFDLQAGRHYLVMERGYLGDIEMRRQWTSLGFDGLNGRARFAREDDAGERWDLHFSHLMRSWRHGGDYALVMGQVPGDASIDGVDIEAWYEEAAANLEAEWCLPVMFRPHPVASQRGHAADVVGAATLNASLETALDGARVVATYNSNSAVDAVLAGVPALAFDRGSMAWDVTGHDWDLSVRPDRTEWAQKLAWCQWTVDEIASGEAWEHAKSRLD